MSGELERLLVRIEADTTLLRRELANSDKAVANFSGQIDRALSKSQNAIAGFVGQTGRSLLRFGALFGTAALGFKAFESLINASDINDLARNTALSAQTFQSYAFAVERAGGTQEQLSKGLIKLAKNMAELRANTGGFNEFLKTSLPEVQKQLAATRSQEQAVDVLAEALRRLKSEEERSTLAIKAFGKGGEELVEVFGQGSKALNRFIAEAGRLGVVIDQSTLDNFEQLGDTARELGTILEATFVKSVGKAVGYVRAFNAEIAGVGKALGDMLGMNKPAVDAANNRLAGVVAAAKAAAKAASDEAQKTADDSPLAFKVKVEVDNSARDALAALNSQMLSATPGRGREAIYADMDQELQRFKDMLAEKTITDAQFQQARADLSTIAMHKIGANIAEENARYREQFAEFEGLITNTFDGALTQSIRNGKVEWKSLATDMLADLAKIATQALLMKPIMDALFGAGGAGSSLLGGLSSNFGGLFGGARAAGGPVANGKSYLVGEKGPEIFTPGSGGRITPNGATGGGTVMNVYNTIDARGADISVAQRIEAALEASRRAQQNPVLAVSRQQKRFPTRGM